MTNYIVFKEEKLLSNAVVTLKKGEGRALKQGGAWIFDNEIASILGAYENGDIVLVCATSTDTRWDEVSSTSIPKSASV